MGCIGPLQWIGRGKQADLHAADPISQIGWQTLRQPSCPRLPTCWQDPTRQTGSPVPIQSRPLPASFSLRRVEMASWALSASIRSFQKAWGLKGWGLGVPTTCMMLWVSVTVREWNGPNDGGGLPPAVTLSEVCSPWTQKYTLHTQAHRSLFTKGLAHGSYVYMHLNNVSRHLTRYATGSQIPICVLFCYHKLWVSFPKTFTISHSLSHIRSGVSKCQPLIAQGAVLFSTAVQFCDICC